MITKLNYSIFETRKDELEIMLLILILLSVKPYYFSFITNRITLT